MPIEPELLELMLDAVAIEPKIGVSQTNVVQYGEPRSVQCQLSWQITRLIDREGREVTSTVHVILAEPDLVITADDRLTLSNGDSPAILQVLGSKDDVGYYWLEIRA